MIDNLALGLSHGLMLLAAVLLLGRRDLDREDGPPRSGLRPRRIERDRDGEPPLA